VGLGGCSDPMFHSSSCLCGVRRKYKPKSLFLNKLFSAVNEFKRCVTLGRVGRSINRVRVNNFWVQNIPSRRFLFPAAAKKHYSL
jgi:hypothetical protein